jgi:general stress protein 26
MLDVPRPGQPSNVELLRFRYWLRRVHPIMTATMTLEDLRSRVKGVRFAMVTTGDERGTLSSRPLTVQRIDEHGDVCFIVDRDADWLGAGVDAVNVALVDEDGTWVSIAGRARVNHEQALLDELWDPVTDTYFPDGKDSGSAVVFEVQADRWEYWTAGSKVSQLVKLVKAKFAGTNPEIGESGTVET